MNNRPTVLDLFSGIGGFALAFEAAGFETIAFSEIEPYPCKVLKQHWPEVPNLGDVRGIDGEAYRGTVDVVCGGFPCQDISPAGKGAGINGSRSGLWFEMLRIIRGARPAFCLLENVPALRTRGADDVLEGLEEAGYAARAFVVGAVHAGAPHRRQRVWIVAYARGLELREQPGRSGGQDGSAPAFPGEHGAAWPLADTDGLRCEQLGQPEHGDEQGSCGRESDRCSARGWREGASIRSDWWGSEPDVGRVAHGIPARAHRLKALGNSIVPAVAYPFARWMRNQLIPQPLKATE